MKWERAITRLQRANAGVLACPVLNLERLEAAMLERGAAVQMIACLGPEPLPEPELVRLRLALDAGLEIRSKLSSIYRAAQTELQHAQRVRRFLETAPTRNPSPPSYD